MANIKEDDLEELSFTKVFIVSALYFCHNEMIFYLSNIYYIELYNHISVTFGEIVCRNIHQDMLILPEVFFQKNLTKMAQ